MNLKYLAFGHVEGFNDLPEDKQDEFIELFRRYTRDLNNKEMDESSIASIYLAEENDYHVMFLDGSIIVLNINIAKQPSRNKDSTVQVAMADCTHKKIKEMARRENKDIREIVNTACEWYVKYHDRET